MLVDQADEKAARDVATKEADGVEPERIRPWPPNTFACDVFLDVEPGETGEEDDLVVEPLPHVAELLFEWEGDDEGSADTEPAAGAVCGEEADDDAANVVTCARESNHKGDHRSAGGLVWS